MLVASDLSEDPNHGRDGGKTTPTLSEDKGNGDPSEKNSVGELATQREAFRKNILDDLLDDLLRGGDRSVSNNEGLLSTLPLTPRASGTKGIQAT